MIKARTKCESKLSTKLKMGGGGGGGGGCIKVAFSQTPILKRKNKNSCICREEVQMKIKLVWA